MRVRSSCMECMGTAARSGRSSSYRTVATAGVGILHVAERCGMVYLTKSQRDSRALFLALPCRKCGCGIRAKRKEEKDEKDGLGVDAHARTKACKRLLEERLQEEVCL